MPGTDNNERPAHIALKSDKEYFPNLFDENIDKAEARKNSDEMREEIQSVADAGPGKVTINYDAGTVQYNWRKYNKYEDGTEEDIAQWTTTEYYSNEAEETQKIQDNKHALMAWSLRKTALKYIDKPLGVFPRTSYDIKPVRATGGQIFRLGTVCVFDYISDHYRPKTLWGDSYKKVKNHISNKFNNHLIKSVFLALLAYLCWTRDNNLLGFVVNLFDGSKMYSAQYPDPYLFAIMFIVLAIIGFIGAFDFAKSSIKIDFKNLDNISFFAIILGFIELMAALFTAMFITGGSFISHFQDLEICEFYNIYRGFTDEIPLGIFSVFYFAFLALEQWYEFSALIAVKKRNKDSLIKQAEGYLNLCSRVTQKCHKEYRFLKIWAEKTKNKFPNYDREFALYCKRYDEVNRILRRAKRL